jgi:hypothetical protein
MKRVQLLGLFFLWANVALTQAQNPQQQPSPVPPSDHVAGHQLIVWSEMQKPQPVELVAVPDTPAQQQGQSQGAGLVVDSTAMANKPPSTEQNSAATHPIQTSRANSVEAAGK